MMMPQHFEALHKLFEFGGALSVVTGAFAWWRKGTPEDDAMVSDAADVVLDTLADADTVNKVGCVTDKNLRDQLTVEQAIEMDRERNLRRFARRN